jgi:Fur family iron response transcriptional regulator
LELQQQLETRLREKGVRPTRQRMEIGELLLATPRHMSADQILLELREKGSRLSKATVYNTLNLLSKEGIVREIAVDPERMVYDSTAHPHHHFYNVDTGELIDIDDGTVRISGLPELPRGTVEQDVEIIIRVRNAAA